MKPAQMTVLEMEHDPVLPPGAAELLGKLTPDALWQRSSVLDAVAAIAGPLLRAGRLSLPGLVPNGQWFKANPKLNWFANGRHASLYGDDLGEPRPLAQGASLGDFLIPQREVFAIGQAFFEPFSDDRHLAVTSKEAQHTSRSSHRCRKLRVLIDAEK